jgi:hypothetical protein
MANLNRLMLAALSALLFAPLASADHWDDDNGWTPVGDSLCDPDEAQCVLGYLCTGGSPPQIVDTALHCGMRAAGEAQPVALWVPEYAWVVFDAQTAQVDERFATVHDSTVAPVAEANTVLCGTIWSFFCDNPLVVPDDLPVNDPFGAYPL